MGQQQELAWGGEKTDRSVSDRSPAPAAPEPAAVSGESPPGSSLSSRSRTSSSVPSESTPTPPSAPSVVTDQLCNNNNSSNSKTINEESGRGKNEQHNYAPSKTSIVCALRTTEHVTGRPKATYFHDAYIMS